MAEVDIAAMLGAMAADLRDMRRENKAEHDELKRQLASLIANHPKCEIPDSAFSRRSGSR